MYFKDRWDAGKQLANAVISKISDNTIILALPRGGVPLGICIANKANASLDLVLSKKIGHPSHPEFAIGAMAGDGTPLLNKELAIDSDWLESEIIKINRQIKKRRELYKDILIKQSLENKIILLVDDGIATGMTIFAAIKAVKMHNPAKILVAVPIIPNDTYNSLVNAVDEIISIEVPQKFLGAVGAYYKYFPQITDSEVIKMLTAHFYK